MFRSVRTKVFLAVVLILALVAGVVMSFTKSDVQTAMLQAEERSARNVLKLVELNIAGRYKNLLNDKMRTIRDRKERLQNLNAILMASLTEYAALVEAGTLTREQAQKLAARWLADVRLGPGEYAFAFTREGVAVAYPEAALLGKELTAFTDVKGRSVVQAVDQEIAKYGQAFLTYQWKALDSTAMERKFGFFAPFAKWGWVVGVAGNIQDVEQDVKEEVAGIVSTLASTLPDIRVVRTGYVFLFDGKRQLLVPPPASAGDVTQQVNALTGKPLLDDLMAAAREAAGQGEAKVVLNAAEADGPQFESYVAYFKPLDWYMVSTAATSEIAEPARVLVSRQGMAFGAVLLVSLGLAWGFAATIVRPLERLTGYAKQLPHQDFTQPREGPSPIADLPARYRDEVGRLAETFAFMDESLRENIRSLLDTTAAKHRIEGELNIAKEIQLGLLPKIFPAFPERAEIDLYATLTSAKEVGGDLYDFFILNEHYLCFTVGDVADKGVPAALFMAITKTLIKAAAELDPEPGKIMAKVNDDLSRDNPNSMFVTLFVGLLDMRTGRVAYSNGGHNFPVLLRRDGSVTFLEDLSGPACGAMDGMDFDTHALDLAPGEAIYVYTDGVTEAMSPTKDQFSDERLLQVLTGVRDASAADLVETCMLAVRDHAAGADQSDDITMLCVRYRGPAASA